MKLETKQKPNLSHSFDAIGTKWTIDIYQSYPPKIVDDIAQRITDFDTTYSRFKDDSFVRMVSAQPGRYDLPHDALPLFDFYRQLYDITDGSVTPLIGQMMSDAGYDSSYSFKSKPLTSPPAWDETFSYTDTELIIKNTCLFDFGAAGKGYLVDIISQLLTKYEITQYCVDAGGDVYASNAPQIIGLENPIDTTQAIGVAKLINAAICGSSGNRRTWEGFNHILDPHLQQSPQHIAAVWVVANSTMLADGLTTALYFVEPHKLNKFDFEYVIMHTDGSAILSDSFPGELF